MKLKISEIFKSFRFLTIFSAATIIIISFFAIYLDLKTEIQKQTINKIYLEQEQILNNYLYDIQNELQIASNTTINLAAFLSNFNSIEERHRRQFFIERLEDIISTKKIYAIWTVFTPYSIDNYDDDFKDDISNLTGQFAASYVKINEKIVLNDITKKDYQKLSHYLKLFRNNKQLIIEYNVPDDYNNLKNLYLIRFVSPIYNNGKIVGIIGIDIPNTIFKNQYAESKGTIFVLNPALNVVYSNRPSQTNKNILELFINLRKNTKFLSQISLFDEIKAYDNLFSNDKVIYTVKYSEIPGSNIKLPIIFFQKDSQYKQMWHKRLLAVLITPFIMGFLMLIFVLFFSFFITKHYMYTIYELSELTKDSFISKSSSKIKEINYIYILIRRISKNLDTYKTFIQKLHKEEYDVKLPLEPKDKLYIPLNQLRDKLKSDKQKQEEFYKEQEIIGTINKNLAELNNLQRDYFNDLDNLTYESIKFLSDFTKAVQGGFYILDEKKENLELKAFYSYNRRVYHIKKIKIGEGMAGTCAQEKLPIFTTIPDNYLEISSGLGKDKPKYIFLVPLIHNQQVYGVIELAFLTEPSIHYRNFIISAAEGIAGTLASAQENLRTQQLLAETQKIREEMQRKEIELNNQIKELQISQEGIKLRELDNEALIQGINRMLLYAEFDIEGNVLYLNDNLSHSLDILAIDASLLNYYDLFFITNRQIHEEYWRMVKDGRIVQFELFVIIGKKRLWLNSLLIPVYNTQNNVYKVIYLAIDITQIKVLENTINELRTKINELETTLQFQEGEMEVLSEEHSNFKNEILTLKEKIKSLSEEKTQIEKSKEFLEKEFKKRFARDKKIKQSMREEIQNLKDILKKYNQDTDEKDDNNDKE